VINKREPYLEKYEWNALHSYGRGGKPIFLGGINHCEKEKKRGETY